MYCGVIVATGFDQELTYKTDDIKLLRPGQAAASAIYSSDTSGSSSTLNTPNSPNFPSSPLLSIGQLVIVPLRNRPVVGIVVSVFDKKKDINFGVKCVSHVLPYVLSENNLNFLKWFSAYNLILMGMALKMMIPFSAEELIKSSESLPTSNAKVAPISLTPIALNTFQQRAVDQLLSRKDFSVDLIDGVTGSGKTEVYFAAIKRRLQQSSNAQILILLPEIALTTALINRFEKYFNFKPHVWHSSTTKAQKLKIWTKIIAGERAIVIGARSALFLPFVNLATIIVDEEHDSSYKQNEQGHYNARDMAIACGRIEGIPVILASATPSLETVLNVRSGRFGVATLASRYADAAMPSVCIVDMRQERGRPIISTPLSEAMHSALEKKEQILIFVNQRGYAPLSLCKSCGYRWKCSMCDVNLIEHKSPNCLMCHHCGNRQSRADVCPECSSPESRIALGVGTERVLEAIKCQFPEARCLVVSSDTISSKKMLKTAMTSIFENEVDVILGTQILAKGHHFPNLTVVGVIEADQGINGCDLRANERTYQLLDQVSGRAGREKKRGVVFLQTYAPENPLMVALANHDRDVFYANELDDRKAHGMPPFKMLIAVIVSGEAEIDVQKESRRLAQSFMAIMARAKEVTEGDGARRIKKADAGIVNSAGTDGTDQQAKTPATKEAAALAKAQLLGPAPAPIAKLRGQYRYRLLIKTDKGSNLQSVIKQWAKSSSTSVSVTVDVDPYEFL
ncbi:MAG: primosomal protein N' [Holosporales bacterium]|nr:primosomal protein N' [Holosporales bacterium]